MRCKRLSFPPGSRTCRDSLRLLRSSCAPASRSCTRHCACSDHPYPSTSSKKLKSVARHGYRWCLDGRSPHCFVYFFRVVPQRLDAPFINFNSTPSCRVEAGTLKILLALFCGLKLADKAKCESKFVWIVPYWAFLADLLDYFNCPLADIFSVLINANGGVDIDGIGYFCSATQLVMCVCARFLFLRSFQRPIVACVVSPRAALPQVRHVGEPIPWLPSVCTACRRHTRRRVRRWYPEAMALRFWVHQTRYVDARAEVSGLDGAMVQAGCIRER